MNFEFTTAQRIIFGRGCFKKLSGVLAAFSSRLLIVTGQTQRLSSELAQNLEGFSIDVLPVSCEPTVQIARDGAVRAREIEADAVVGLGGGSAIDAAKAIAVLATNPGDVLDYLEVIGGGRALEKEGLPCIAIPTTAGTGTEVTRNSVLHSPAHRVKVSLRGAHVLPRIALVDPALTDDLPPELTASTGMDALTQVIEPFVCTRANPMTDGYCEQGIARAGASLEDAFRTGNPGARDEMSVASLFGGLSLANAGLGAVHGFAGPLGGMYAAPHGAICAALLPSVMEMNCRALESRQPAASALKRYDRIAQLLSARNHVTRWDGIAWVKDLCRKLQIKGLASWGVKREDFEEIVKRAELASSMKPNPINLSRAELLEILEKAL
jgi:alcohol dehydrogenase class IV